MGKFSFSVSIHRAQQEVFDFLSDPANLPKWSSAFESAAWTTNDTRGVGSTYRVAANLLGSRKEGLVEIVQWARPNLYSYRLATPIFPIKRMQSTIRLEPDHGGTQVRFESEFDLVGALKFAEGFFAKFGEKQDGQNFYVAKRLLEAS